MGDPARPKGVPSFHHIFHFNLVFFTFQNTDGEEERECDFSVDVLTVN